MLYAMPTLTGPRLVLTGENLDLTSRAFWPVEIFCNEHIEGQNAGHLVYRVISIYWCFMNLKVVMISHSRSRRVRTHVLALFFNAT
jgi:hypothetical protein